MNIGVVILNYLNWADTIECVDSILKQTYENLQIVIVDNHSNNGSEQQLVSHYETFENVHVLISTKNEGFARGNNIGITYCLDELRINNIFVANNDTIFTDKDFFLKLSNTPIDSTVGVIGTKIIGSDGLNQNPFYARIDWQFLLKKMVVLKWNFIRSFLESTDNIVSNTVLKAYFSIKGKNDSVENSRNEITPKLQSDKDLTLLHGSAIFFTENYLKIFRGFYPDTFLYNEERILYLLLERAKLTSSFLDNVELYHKEDQSSALSFGNDSDKMKIYNYKSTKEVIKVKLSSSKKIKNSINTRVYNYTEVN